MPLRSPRRVKSSKRHIAFVFFQKHLILLIKGLCTGCSRLDRTEIITFTAMMKSAKLPQTVKTLSDGGYSFARRLLGRFPVQLLAVLPSHGTVLIPLFAFVFCSGRSERVGLTNKPRVEAEGGTDEFFEPADVSFQPSNCSITTRWSTDSGELL